MPDTVTWTTVPIRYEDVEEGDRLVHHSQSDIVETVTEVRHLDSYVSIFTDGPLIGDVYYSSDQGRVSAPNRPLNDCTLSRADGTRPDFTRCTCLYRRTLEGSWRRLTVDPTCTEPHR